MMVENALITASVTTASVVIIVLVFVFRRINELDDKGEPTKNYKTLSSFLAYGALLGMVSAIFSTIRIILGENFQLTLSFKLRNNLLAASYSFFILELTIITFGVIFLVHREIGTGHIIDYLRSWHND